MEPEKRETVVVDNGRSSSPLGWIIGLAVIIILVILFFMTNGFGLLNNGNGSSTGTDTMNVDTPDNVNFQTQPSGQ